MQGTPHVLDGHASMEGDCVECGYKGFEHAPLKLRYDGKYDFIPAPQDRQWTLMSHFIDANGADRFHGSFSLAGLQEIGAIKGGN